MEDIHQRRSFAQKSSPDTEAQMQPKCYDGPREKRSNQMYIALPKAELWLYCTFWCCMATYWCYCVFAESQVYTSGKLRYIDEFKEGWKILNRKKDISDFEWSFWSGWFLRLYPWLIGHIIVGQIFRMFSIRGRGPVFLVYSMLAMGMCVGWQPVVLITVQCVLVYMAARTRSPVLVWIVSLLVLSLLNFRPTANLLRSIFTNDVYELRYHITVFTFAMVNIRCVSFALECCDEQTSIDEGTPASCRPPACEKTHFKLWRMLLYAFYLPLCFTGPLLTYNNFVYQFEKPAEKWTIVKLKRVVLDTCRVVFWVMFTELTLHYMYFSAMLFDSNLMSSTSLWTLSGIGYLHGQFFMVKYVSMFGIPRNIAALDNIDAPLGPKCISRIYMYSDMWKYFDRGLYNFITRHIYIPLGGSRKGIKRQLLASGACFMYVFYWHGGEYYLFLWTVINYLGIVTEALCKGVASKLRREYGQTSWLCGPWGRRFEAVCWVPLFAISSFAIFYFFGGIEVGNIFVYRLLVKGFPQSTLWIIVTLYTFIQTAMEIRQWESCRTE